MRRILYTGREGKVSEGLRSRGYDVDCHRVIRNDAIAGAAERVTAALTPGSWLVITSPTAATLLEHTDLPVATSGESTSRAARRAGFDVVLTAPQPAGAASLAAAFATQPRRRLVLAVSALASGWLASELVAHGHDVTRVDLYTTRPDPEQLGYVASRWGSWDVTIVASASGADALASAVDLATSSGLVALGEPTAKALARHNAPHVVSAGTRASDLAAAIEGVIA